MSLEGKGRACPRSTDRTDRLSLVFASLVIRNNTPVFFLRGRFSLSLSLSLGEHSVAELVESSN